MSSSPSRKLMSAHKWAGIIGDAIAASALVVVLTLTVATIILRTLRLNLPDALDFSSLCMGIAMFWGLSVAFLNNSNIRVELLSSLLRSSGRKALLVFGNLVAVVFILTMAYACYRYLQTAVHSGEVTPQLRVAIWPFIGLAWLGLCATAFSALLAALSQLRPGIAPDQHNQDDFVE